MNGLAGAIRSPNVRRIEIRGKPDVEKHVGVIIPLLAHRD